MRADLKMLWRTNVGSHMWGMNRPDSDVDVYEAYMVPTVGILRGLYRDNSHNREETHDGTKWEIQGHEIAVVIDQLLKGNMNHLWGTLSPIVIEPSDDLTKISRIARENVAKNCAHSILGMAHGNYHKYIVREKLSGHALQKRCNMICRSLKWGIGIVERKDFEFKPYYDGSPQQIDILLKEMENATASSMLPERPDDRPFRDLLEEIRMRDLTIK